VKHQKIISSVSDDTCTNNIDIELFIRPSAHTKQGLSHSDVLKIVLEESERLAGIYNLKHGIGLCVDNTDDGIVEMTNVVFLAVQNRDKICGFGFYGFDREHSTGTQRNIKKLYNLLKKNQVNVCISAGKTDVQPVVTALHVGGACRLNGCFAVERDPSMLSYLANHAVPIELSLTNLYSKCFDDISDTGDALRLFFDRGLKIAPCSLDLSLYPQSRNEMMYKMALKANFTVREIVEFIMFSYTAASLNYADKRTLFRAALEETKQILQESNVSIDLL
jgi:adenosine deaminase